MKNIWIWLVVAVVVIGGGYWYWQSQQAPAVLSDDGTSVAADAVDDSAANNTASSTSGTTVTAGVAAIVSTAPMTATVTFNGDAFSPSTVTVAKGGTVTFTSTGGNMWVASNPHPAHSGYDGTTMQQHCAAGYTGAAPFDQCVAGTSFTFTFNKAGTWGYHDHLNHGLTGTVIVQ